MVSNLIQAGDKVELCLIKQMEQEQKTGIRVHIYQSRVADIYKDGGLELHMPMEEGRYILLPIGARLEMVFYAKSGLYRAQGLVEERYNSNNMHMLRASLKSRLYKYQQREYFWISCAYEVEYYDITASQALGASSRQLQALAAALKKKSGSKKGTAAAVNGAGLRFVTDVINKTDSYILLKIKDIMNENLMPAYILSSEAVPGRQDLFENRAEFIVRDPRIQDDMIRDLFDEGRKNSKERSSVEYEKKYFGSR